MDLLPILLVLLPLSTYASEELTTFKVNVSTYFKKYVGYPEDNYLNFTQIVTKYGYKAEEHVITTEDGYILRSYRLTGGNCSTFKSVPVILMHGVFYDSYIYIDAGPDAGLAYLLADACYDVWIPNARGTPDSRAHKTLDPNRDSEFWQYSVNEIGYYDNPAIIDYIINLTGSQKVNYIGYSQGGAAAAITLSSRPEYNAKIGVNIGLGPALRLRNTRSPMVRLSCKLSYLLQDFLAGFGIYEILERGSLTQVLLEFLCHDLTFTRNFCSGVITLTDDYDPTSIQDYTLKGAFAHLLAGQSVKQYAHYHQWTESGNFSKYDYGTEKNLKVYGTERSPLYDISKATAPTVFITGKSDNMVSADDVTVASTTIPNLLELYVIEDPAWNHLDFIYSSRIPTLLFPKVNQYLSAYSSDTSAKSNNSTSKSSRAKKYKSKLASSRRQSG